MDQAPPANGRAHSRARGSRFLAICFGIASILLATASTAIAYPPSAFDQYTEQPPGDATGPHNAAIGEGGDRTGNGGEGSGGAAGQSGATGSSPTGTNGATGANPGSQAQTKGGGDQTGSGTEQGNSTGASLAADTRPTNSLIWIAVLAIAGALLVRAVMAVRGRAGGTVTR